ncbi:hypothetical protein [Amycolatopsis alba]|uniref:Secreted protein n=1 Tax=Amycolatopsis alba DSM 44262 TaxID=1125972 RepID=A0A229RCK7_AMYAL|nr:hypothetical protein [Amycolatopsis alba]OXM44181.1 hypothetical protein CFP75_35365 [Amycolatopsis alba DSM 44262]
MNIKKFGLAATGAVMAFGSLFAATPATAAQAIDGQAPRKEVVCQENPYNLYPPGGWAQFTVRCGGNTVAISGWVLDTKKDGKCAYVKVYWPSENRTVTSPRACPEKNKKSYTFYGLYAANPVVTAHTD